MGIATKKIKEKVESLPKDLKLVSAELNKLIPNTT